MCVFTYIHTFICAVKALNIYEFFTLLAILVACVVASGGQLAIHSPLTQTANIYLISYRCNLFRHISNGIHSLIIL